MHLLQGLEVSTNPPLAPHKSSLPFSFTIESVLTSCITCWSGNCSLSDRKTRQHAVRMSERIIAASFCPPLQIIFEYRCRKKAPMRCVRLLTALPHGLFNLLPYGGRSSAISSREVRMFGSIFFPPTGIKPAQLSVTYTVRFPPFCIFRLVLRDTTSSHRIVDGGRDDNGLGLEHAHRGGFVSFGYDIIPVAKR